MDITAIQESIRRSGLDGWLFFDHHQRDPLAYKILRLSTDLHASRRWYYFVPSSGIPMKLVSRIEPHVLDSLPGAELFYSGWQEQRRALQTTLDGAGRVAMQYSPKCAVPYVSMVDAGTLELVKSCGVDVASSADLVAEFEAVWTNEQFEMHVEAVGRVEAVRRLAFDLVAQRLRRDERVTEYEVQRFILMRFADSNLVTDHGPIVATNEHAADPHFEPSESNDRAIVRNDFLLIDMWAKLNRTDSVFADITWNAYCGETIPDPIQRVFEAVRDARRAACRFVVESIASGRKIAGYQVDDAAREVVQERGYGESFIHRTGHSIGTEVHGTGANMDNFESHDERTVLAGTCFSVEPGVYLRDFGIRSEVDVFVGADKAFVTTEEQEELLRL